jgi:hypothetical protein
LAPALGEADDEVDAFALVEIGDRIGRGRDGAGEEGGKTGEQAEFRRGAGRHGKAPCWRGPWFFVGFRSDALLRLAKL